MKLSGKNGFWWNIRKTDKHLYKASIKYQKNYWKFKKAELDLFWCKYNGWYVVEALKTVKTQGEREAL